MSLMSPLENISTYQSGDRLKAGGNEGGGLYEVFSNIKGTVLASIMSALSLTGCTQNPDLSKSSIPIGVIAASEIDAINEETNIAILLKASMAGFDMDDFRYEMTINPSIRSDIYVLGDPRVLTITKAISDDFFHRTGIKLAMIDIIAVAKIVRLSIPIVSDSISFEEELTRFLSHYSAYQDIFREIFGKFLGESA